MPPLIMRSTASVCTEDRISEERHMSRRVYEESLSGTLTEHGMAIVTLYRDSSGRIVRTSVMPYVREIYGTTYHDIPLLLRHGRDCISLCHYISPGQTGVGTPL